MINVNSYPRPIADVIILEDAVESLNESAPFWLQIVVSMEGYVWRQSREHFRPEYD